MLQVGVRVADDLLGALAVAPTTRKETLGRIANLLERNGVNLDEIGRVQRISLYQSLTKNADGEAEVHDLMGVQLSPTWEEGPQWPVVQPAAPIRINATKARPAARQTRITAILPDPQIGYRRLHDGELIACHDDAAIDVALQIVAAVKPDVIVNLGDTLDFPEWSSKFVVKPEFVLTTQPTIDEAHRFLARQRATAPDAEIVLLGGNHDKRIADAITRNAMAALRLRRAAAPDEWPVLSIPNLLRLDDLGVTYVGAYPAGRWRISTGNGTFTPLWAVHGERLDVVKVAKAERQSFVQGHIHRVQLHTETYEINGQPETVVAFSPGCLCKIDGTVPSTKSGEDEHGRPVTRWENWQQGVAIVEEDCDGFWHVELVPIHHGKAIWRGKVFSHDRQ
jgi:hypothetical protein